MIDDEKDRLVLGDAVIAELRQFERLRAVLPALTCAEIAHRMVWSRRDTRWLLQKMNDRRK